MNEDVKKIWVDALRSGEYEQGTKALHRVNGEQHSFCCLGVLCDIAEKAGIVNSTLNSDSDLYAYNGIEAVLPVVVQEWAGINANPRVENADGSISSAVAVWNDVRRASFVEIADMIESSL